MSYIHDALKRAQQERDTLYEGYGTIIGASAKSGSRRYVKTVAVLSVMTVLILAAAVMVRYDLNRFETSTAEGPLASAMAASGESGESADLLYGKALAHHEQGNLAEAARIYRRILDGDPSYRFAANNLGVIYLARSDREKAKTLFIEATRGDGEYADPWYNLACLHAGDGERDRALDYLEKALAINNKVKRWAEHDTDLAVLQSSPRFLELLGRREAFADRINPDQP